MRRSPPRPTGTLRTPRTRISLGLRSSPCEVHAGRYLRRRSEAPALAAYAGAKALGFSVCFRNHQHWHGEIDDFELVVVNGLWHAGSKVAKAYIAAFRPVIITDLGYLGVRGHGGYWQMGLRRLNWIPPNDCPSDRFEELGIELLDRAPLDASAPVLIAGQMPGDASHGLDEAGLSMSLVMVRKKLGLNLRLEKVDGNRVYRIVPSSGARSAARPSGDQQKPCLFFLPPPRRVAYTMAGAQT